MSPEHLDVIYLLTAETRITFGDKTHYMDNNLRLGQFVVNVTHRLHDPHVIYTFANLAKCTLIPNIVCPPHRKAPQA